MVVMAGSSYFAYTTAGFDFEVETSTGVEVIYYRVRWDDGATWAGRAVQGVARPTHALDWFDPGGTWMAMPSRPGYPHWWNRFGFWWITSAADDPYVPLRYPGASESYWMAIPSWLVMGLVGVPWLIRVRNHGLVRLVRSQERG